MVKPARVLLIATLVSACALLLSACGDGDSGNNPTPLVITAHANIPTSATVGGAFTVSVSLTSSDNSGGTASVQPVDVGTVTPKIDCGSPQTLTIGGNSQNFSCQASQANLGSSNTHQLQVNVDGVANLASPVSVEVVNGGEVDVQLTNVSGTAITQAAPGQTINVAFSTTTTPTGVGQYTVTAPSGWTVGNSGVCDVNAQSISCNVPVTVAASAASGAYTLAIAAEEGSSSLSATSLSLSVKESSAITAHASIPSSVDAEDTFTVSVSLTSSGGSGGTASVQPVDVGTVTPHIDCGQPQTLDINGAGKDFSCQAPSVNLGSNNTHQLQVNVNGVPNLDSPVSVDVVNGGQVDVKLTNASGTPITTASPGQTINAAFTTTTTPPGVGKYTVTAPSGWAVGNSGICEINAQSTSCNVPVTIAASAVNGTYNLTIAAEEGSSQLSTTRLSLSVQSQPPTSDMAFDVAQNVSDTLYANLPSQATTFTYQPVFLFKNTSGGSLSIASVNASGLTSVQYACNVTPKQNADYTFTANAVCTLNASGLYAVSGDLPNSFPAPSSATAPAGVASISISVLGGGQTYVQHDKTITFVKYVPGHVAVRVVNNNAADTVHAAATHQPLGNINAYMVQFDSSHIGTPSAVTASGNFKANQLTLSKSGGLLYIPYENGGALYLTRGTGGFNTTTVPSPTGSPTPPAYLTIEMTYKQNLPGGQCSGSTCESLTVDQTYVNFISMLGSFNAMGNAAPLALTTESVTNGTVTDKTQTQVYQEVKTYFANQGSPWAYDSSRGKQNYIQEDGNDNITSLLAPIQVYGSTTYDPMPDDYYQDYITKFWTYLENQPINVEATLAGDVDCVLQGQVVPASSTSPNAGQLVFNQSSGTCPVVNGTSPNNIAFYGLNKCDFVKAAADCGHAGQLYGPNNTYRSIVGETIAAYQAIGLLPQCSDPTKLMNPTNAFAAVSAGTAFSNPTCLGLTSPKPAWNVYAAALRPYINVYTYSYGDFLGIDGTITLSVNALPVTLYQNLQVAQPITITLH